MGVERGSLVLADISGYTKYLSGVELDHSHDILADLLSAVVRNLVPPLELAKLEGDAVFCFVRDAQEEARGTSLVTLVEGCYFGFQQRQRDIQQATTCTCEACRRIPELTLKFLVHHGEFVLHDIMGNRELVGPDVILAHRLLKNSVTERTGLRGYALFTAFCLSHFGIDAGRAGMGIHEETYEDVGAVPGYLLDLERRWREEQARTSVYLGPGEAMLEVERRIAAPPQVVWDWVTNPRRRAQWQAGVDRVDQENPSELPGVGTTNHCMHGPDAIVEEIVDWKPFRYLTDRSHVPIGTALGTIELTPIEAETVVSFRLQPEVSEEMLPTAREMMAQFDQLIQTSLERLAELVAESHRETTEAPATAPS